MTKCASPLICVTNADSKSAFFFRNNLFLLFFAVGALVTSIVFPLAVYSILFLLPISIYVLWNQQLNLWNMSGLLMLCWGLWIPATLAWSMSPGMSLSHVGILIGLPFGWLTGLELQRRGVSAKFLGILIPSTLIVLVVWGVAQGPNTYSTRPQGPFNDANTFAAFLNLLIFPVFAKYFAADLPAQSPLQRLFPLLLISATGFVAFLIASRGASLSFLIATGLLLWMSRGQPFFVRKVGSLVIVLLAAYLFSTYTKGDGSIVQRLGELVETGDGPRMMLFHSAWLMICDSSWLGTGLGSFKFLYPKYRFPAEVISSGGWAHNDYLQLTLEAGMPMLLMLLLLVGLVLGGIMRSRLPTNRGDLLGLGYFLGVFCVLSQAMVNFVLYFSPICVFVGVYLAVAVTWHKNTSQHPIRPARAGRIAVAGYSFILSYMLLGLMAAEAVLPENGFFSKKIRRHAGNYSRYETAYALSVIAPFHPASQQVMGFELANLYFMAGKSKPEFMEEAITRMEASWRLAPCHFGISTPIISLLAMSDITPRIRQSADVFIERNLSCNPRHGLSYYYAGLFAMKENKKELALRWWQAGIASSQYFHEQLILVCAIQSVTMKYNAREIGALTERMAEMQLAWEAAPAIKPNFAFWNETLYKVVKLTGVRLNKLLEHTRGAI